MGVSRHHAVALITYLLKMASILVHEISLVSTHLQSRKINKRIHWLKICLAYLKNRLISTFEMKLIQYLDNIYNNLNLK